MAGLAYSARRKRRTESHSGSRFKKQKRGGSTPSVDEHILDGTPERTKQRYRGLAKRALDTDFGDLDADVVIIDTETTGVSFKSDELTQIAAARMRKGEVVDWFVTFVNPGMPIPEEITLLTSIDDTLVADAPSPQEALSALSEFVGESYLVAHNANFDKTFCTRHPQGAPLADRVWVDSLDLARIAVPRLRSHRLIDLVRAFDAPLSTHRADADVEALCAIYRVLLAAVDAMPAELVGYIAHLAPIEEWPTAKVFLDIEALQAQRLGSQAQQTLDGRAVRTAGFDLRSMRSKGLEKIATKRHVDAEQLAGDPLKPLEFATEEEIEEAFSQEGIAGRMYESYESRAEQVELSKAVNRAFASSTNLVVEAGTGVGKSVGYLLPAALAARKNNITIGVATKTNALLDQLVNRELPLLAQQLDGLTYASLKGFSHYLCLHSLERLLGQGAALRQTQDGEVSQAPSLAAILSFVEQTDYDDIDALKADYRAVPRSLITTSSADCLRRKCPFYGERCYVHGARLRAESADIVVTNHALLFCDVVAEGGLLPPIRYWVVDEAHGAEDEARRAFSYELSAEALKRLAARVSAPDASRNPFLRAERQVGGREQTSVEQLSILLGRGTASDQAPSDEASQGTTLLYALSAKARGAGGRFATSAQAFADHIHDLLYFDDSGKRGGYDQVDLWLNDQVRSSTVFANLRSHAQILCDDAEKLIKASQELSAFLDDIEGAGAVQREVASVAIECKDILSACQVILFDGPPTYAYAAHLVKNKPKKAGRFQAAESLSALMLSVADTMNDLLFDNTHSVVFTSATMTVADSFDNFTTALGLGARESSAVSTLQLASSFDFDAHMTVYVVEDMPEPNDPAYLDALNQLLIGVHRAQGGSALTLFTNKRDMEKCHSVVQEALRADDLRVVCQRWGVSTKWLREEFLRDEKLSLFALKSFWEGFDAPGATLRAVIIPKLPFAKPTDPLSCERALNDPNAWRHYVLPAAVLETKQAAGRLIRTATDRGVLVLADKRLVSKGYGKTILASLPSRTIKVLPARDVVQQIAETRA